MTRHSFISRPHRGARGIAAAAAVAALATTTLALVACGGGSGGGGGSGSLPVGTAPAPTPAPPPAPATAPAPAPAPAPSNAAAACTNEADFHPGTVLDYVFRTTSPSAPTSTVHNTVTTDVRQPFAGANPVTFVQTLYDLDDKPFTSVPIFRDLIDGKVVAYGTRTGSGNTLVTTTNEPPPATPIDLAPGQTVNLAYRATAVSTGGSYTVDVTEALTYQGRETLQTAVGSFDTCRFVAIASTTTPDNAGKLVVNVTSWIAAEGPYRGQRLKSFTAAGANTAESTSEVTRMVYTPK